MGSIKICFVDLVQGELKELIGIQQKTILDVLFSAVFEKHTRFIFPSRILLFRILYSFRLQFPNHFKWHSRMRATKRAPVKFPDRAPLPIIHLQVCYGCFPLLWFLSPHFRLEIALSLFPHCHATCPPVFFIETLPGAWREIWFGRRRQREKHDIHSARTPVSPGRCLSLEWGLQRLYWSMRRGEGMGKGR